MMAKKGQTEVEEELVEDQAMVVDGELEADGGAGGRQAIGG